MCNHSNQCTQQLTQPAHQNTHPLLLVLPFVNSKWREFDWFRKSKWISNNKSMSLLKSKTMLFVRHLFGELVHSFSLFVHAPVCSVTALRYNLQVWKSRGKIQGKKFSYIQSSLLVLLLLVRSSKLANSVLAIYLLFSISEDLHIPNKEVAFPYYKSTRKYF